MGRVPLVVASTLFAASVALPAGGQGQTVDGKQVLTARYTATAPVIDGQMGAGEWGAAPAVHVEFDSPTVEPGVAPDYMYLPAQTPDDLSFDIQALYDGSYLYVAVAVRDDVVIHDSDTPLDDDCVHLQFDGDREQDPEAEYGPGIEWNDVFVDTHGDTGCIGCDYFGSVFEWQSAPGLVPGGYVIEARIALSSIDVEDGPGQTAAGAGDYIGFNVTLEDDDNGGQAYNNDTPGQTPDPSDNYGRWTSRDSWSDTRNWGLLYFDPDVTTRVGAAAWAGIKRDR